MSDLVRSKALNLIPTKKLYYKLLSVIKSCELCSHKTPKNIDGFDGLCSKCSTIHIAYNRYAEANIPIEYWDLSMEKDFKGYQPLLDKYQIWIKDIKNFYIEGISICLAGAHGRGKTFCHCSLLKRACLKGYTCLYTTLFDVVNVLTQGSGEDKYLARRELTMVDFLFCDEVDGRFYSTDNAADLYARTLEGIFRIRSQNKLPTLMATNSPNLIESFNGALKESMESLMKGYVQVNVVLGDDYRKVNK